ncbi:MAG: single-stranded-DNA-specific exonuclease RecJ [Nitrospirota bacterium]|nr:single-stranded-DNA-specific exonuclease RecJ [Nitrospirota bacterium]
MKWVLAEHDAGAAALLSRETGISPLMARLLVVRGIGDLSAARSFLSTELSSLSDPRTFRDMDQAVTRISEAIRRHEPITVFGDYDVDGVTGSAVLFLALRDLGADVQAYIPDRMSEGYGLNSDALGRLAGAGVRLVITVDCGISALREADHARSLGIDLIITDHHESDAMRSGSDHGQASVFPRAFAILHPSLLSENASEDVRQRVSGLTGVGMAFKLVQGLLKAESSDPVVQKYLDLVTLGTVADMGRITGENRILVRHGLNMLSSNDAMLRPGVAALKQAAGISGKRVTVGTVGFSLAPRINASGRLARADTAFRLLTTDDPGEAGRLANDLDAVNRERQAVEESIWKEARERCLAFDPAATGAFVLSSPAWHPGVVGIVASRISDEFYRPAVLIAVKDGVGKGSARSIPGYDLYSGLSRCSDILLGFGGHKYAAGLSISEEQVPRLQERLSADVRESLGAGGFVRKMTIDAPITFNEINLDLLNDIDRMSPYGQGNPEPRLGSKELEVLSVRTVGNGSKHVKMRLRQKESSLSFEAIAYGKGEQFGSRLRPGKRIAVVFTPRMNTWNNMSNIELDVRDIKVDE